MSLELCILASGSSGNSALLRAGSGVMLIDAGLGPRMTAKRMNGTGVCLRDVRAICLTHLDTDHFRPSWLGTILNHGIHVFCHRHKRDRLLETLEHEAVERLVHGFDDRPFEPLGSVKVRALPLSHDRTGSHGFVIDSAACRIGYATDLGHIPHGFYEMFADLDLIALESNYDCDMQLGSARPAFLKHRIMGGAGHLSNAQALEAVRTIVNRASRRGRLPAHIVLLHRSRQCNCPKLLRRLFEQDHRIARRLTLAEQYARTDWLRVRPSGPLVGEQLSLAW
jgi:phosphoribosyl 1,2-cyclic phosphodiesterase